MANYNSAYTGAQIDEAIGKVISKESTWDGKQDALGFTPVPNTRKVNGKALSSDITLTATDVGAVPTTRKVNNKALSQDITLSASDVGAIPASQKGTANGVAELDANGKVPSSQLPSYVDDVLEYDKLSSFPSTGETGKIYVALDTNKTYRWSGSSYVEISPSIALGETASTAYRGDRGKIAYDHSQTTGNPHGTTPADIGAVPTTRKINGKSLTADVSLSATDVGAAAASHTHTKSQISDFPASMIPTAHASTHKTGGSDALTPADIGAAEAAHTHEQADITGLSAALDSKVDKVTGKGLSTEDYTTAEKNKLAGIEAGAQVNTVTSVAGKTGAVTLAKSDVGLGNVDNVKQMPIAGGTFTGIVTAQSNTSYLTRQIRNFVLSTADPSGGSNGDVWIKWG